MMYVIMYGITTDVCYYTYTYVCIDMRMHDFIDQVESTKHYH